MTQAAIAREQSSRNLVDALTGLLRNVRAFAASPASSSTEPAPAPTVTIERDESPSEFAARHGISMADLVVANGLGFRARLTPGMQIVIPPQRERTNATSAGADVSITKHIVRDEDTLESLAAHFGAPPELVLRANGLADESSIVPGMSVVMPSTLHPADTGEIPRHEEARTA